MTEKRCREDNIGAMERLLGAGVISKDGEKFTILKLDKITPDVIIDLLKENLVLRESLNLSNGISRGTLTVNKKRKYLKDDSYYY
jgi:hypothetical protein